jgi:zinc protease
MALMGARSTVGATIAALATIVAAATAVAQQATANPPPVPAGLTPLEVRVADNVFVVPDPYAKSVSGWLLVRAGCADEAPTCNGLAHYLEHLLFINRDADHRSKVALFPSGNGNGWTSHTATGYVQSFPVQAATKAQNLDKLVAYLAGHLKDVRAEPGQADRERNIVLQEHLQRVGSSPQARFGQKRTALLLPNDPLGRSVGGDPSTIKAFDIPSATAFHQAWYTQRNVAFVFSGPITADEIKPLVAAHIAPLPVRPVPARSWLKAAAVPIGRETITESDKDVTRPIITYDKVVSYREPASEADQLVLNAARNVVSTYLGSRMAGSPLHQLIDKTELIASGSFGIQKVRPGQLRVSFQGSPVDGVTPERLAAAVRRQIDGLKPGAITPAYLARLKKRAAVGRALLQEEPSRYANSLVGWLQSVYPYEAWRDRAAYDERLAIKHINEVLRAVARPGREVVGTLTPSANAAAAAPLATSPPASPQTSPAAASETRRP